MTSKSTSPIRRARAVGQLGAVALFAAALAVACSSSSDNPGGSSGAGGTGNHGGSANPGGKGGGGAAGSPDTSGGSGGAAKGGSGGGLGQAGSDEAGAPGASGPVCGNGALEAGEECDDGNTKDGDGCSSVCTNKCEQCEQANCTADPDTAAAFEACYGDDPSGKVAAQDGPAAGTPRNKLCQALIACVRRTNCGAITYGDPINGCVCGDANSADCDANPQGKCADEVAAAAESRTLVDIRQRKPKVTFAVGMAYELLYNCDYSACGHECLQDKAATSCDKCALGPSPTAYSYTCSSYESCYFNPGNSPSSAVQRSTAR